MAGLSKNVPQPTEITLHQATRALEISFAAGKTFRLPCEFLRVYSPSAEVRGHDTGIYSWDLLHNYGMQQETMWQQYLQRLQAAGASREKP